MTTDIESDPESLLNKPEPLTGEEERYNNVKMTVTRLRPDAHVGRFTRKRRDLGYVSPRRKYQSTYYQKNKDKIKKHRRERYSRSEEVREYHKDFTRKWRNKSRYVKQGRRTVMRSKTGERLYTSRYACAAFGYSAVRFRTLCEKGIIPQASLRDQRGWRLYTGDQIALLKRAAFHYVGKNPWKSQAILFSYWDNPKEALALTSEIMVREAIKKFPKIKRPKEIDKITTNYAQNSKKKKEGVDD